MLRKQPKPIAFKGGLDASLFKPWHRELIDGIRLDELWFACDRPSSVRKLEAIRELLKDIPTDKKRCFVLVGYEDKSVADAERRCQQVYDLGFLPFAQLYRDSKPIRYPTEWKALARKWSRPALYRWQARDGNDIGEGERP